MSCLRTPHTCRVVYSRFVSVVNTIAHQLMIYQAEQFRVCDVLVTFRIMSPAPAPDRTASRSGINVMNKNQAAVPERPLGRVGKYRVLSELGRGGMANVYLAVARGPGGVNKLVVLKALLPDLAGEADALSSFLNEARLAAQLNHANVVQTYEVGTEGDRHVIVMEYLEGQSFSSVLKRAESMGETISLEMKLRIIINVLEGLHYAHELSAYDGSPLSLVHRDVSPQNVFVTYDGQVKILDFGIAKVTASSSNTATGVIKGKIAYMAPEQIVGDSVDRRADIFSVGCMLWATVTGKKLWKDVPDVHIMRRVLHGDIPTPRSVNANCDEELEQIIMRALASDRDARYPTALALQADLERYAERFGAASKQRDLGKMVSKLFAEQRAELRALTERQLSLLASDDTMSSDQFALDFVMHDQTSSRSRTGTGSRSGSGSGSNSRARLLGPDVAIGEADGDFDAQEIEPAAEQRKSRWPLVLLALGLVGAAALYFGTDLLRKQPEQQATPVAQQAAPATTPVAPAPQMVTIGFSATPSTATISVNGQALPSNPSSKVFPVNGDVHRVEASAEGYNPLVQEFTATRDAQIELSLVRSAEQQKEAPSARRIGAPRALVIPPKASAAAAAPKAPEKPKACADPFYIDNAGIKRVRPECM